MCVKINFFVGVCQEKCVKAKWSVDFVNILKNQIARKTHNAPFEEETFLKANEIL